MLLVNPPLCGVFMVQLAMHHRVNVVGKNVAKFRYQRQPSYFVIYVEATASKWGIP